MNLHCGHLSFFGVILKQFSSNKVLVLSGVTIQVSVHKRNRKSGSGDNKQGQLSFSVLGQWSCVQRLQTPGDHYVPVCTRVLLRLRMESYKSLLVTSRESNSNKSGYLRTADSSKKYWDRSIGQILHLPCPAASRISGSGGEQPRILKNLPLIFVADAVIPTEFEPVFFNWFLWIWQFFVAHCLPAVTWKTHTHTDNILLSLSWTPFPPQNIFLHWVAHTLSFFAFLDGRGQNCRERCDHEDKFKQPHNPNLAPKGRFTATQCGQNCMESRASGSTGPRGGHLLRLRLVCIYTSVYT